MNIHGLKQKLIPIKQEIKKGIKELGTARYHRLIRKRTRINDQIKFLRSKKKKKK